MQPRMYTCHWPGPRRAQAPASPCMLQCLSLHNDNSGCFMHASDQMLPAWFIYFYRIRALAGCCMNVAGICAYVCCVSQLAEVHAFKQHCCPSTAQARANSRTYATGPLVRRPLPPPKCEPTAPGKRPQAPFLLFRSFNTMT